MWTVWEDDVTDPPRPWAVDRRAASRAIFSTLHSLKAPSGSCRAGRPFQASTPRLLHRPGRRLADYKKLQVLVAKRGCE
jgi:hypothetical protein